MNATRDAYAHSGKVGMSPIVILLVGVVVAVVVGIVYAYIDIYSPVAGYISVLFTLGFAFTVSFCVARAAQWSKCRNAFLAAILSFLIGLFALYAAWAAFVYVLLQRFDDSGMDLSMMDVFAHPGFVWEFAVAVNEEGWYSVFGGSPSGIVLWGLWAVEALIIVVTITAGPPLTLVDKVFCERCSRWCRSTKDRLLLLIPEDTGPLQRVSDGDIAALEELLPAASSEPIHLRVDIHRCDTCNETATYQATLVATQLDSEGKAEEKTQDITPRFLLNPEELGRLEALAGRPVEPQPTEAQPTAEEAQAPDQT